MARRKAEAEAEVAEVVEVVDPAEDVELTDDEAQAAVDKALADKKTAVREGSAKEQVAAAESEVREERQAEPGLWFGLDMGDGSIAYVKDEKRQGNDRTIRYDLKTYEHVSDDADGIWIYRHLG